MWLYGCVAGCLRGWLATPGWLAVYVALPPADIIVVGHSYAGSQEVDCGSMPMWLAAYVANC